MKDNFTQCAEEAEQIMLIAIVQGNALRDANEFRKAQCQVWTGTVRSDA